MTSEQILEFVQAEQVMLRSLPLVQRHGLIEAYADRLLLERPEVQAGLAALQRGEYTVVTD